MTFSLSFPLDELEGASKDFDRAADYLELSAFFSDDCTTLVSVLANQAGIGAATEYSNLDEEMQSGEEDLTSSTVTRIELRRKLLGSAAYPFDLDSRGEILTCSLNTVCLGHTAYILSLLLSNLKKLSPILTASSLHPDDREVKKLREFFQYFATAALAAELHGSAWSFGFPRLDGSGFHTKLEEVWLRLGDGQVQPQPGAPSKPKDDQIDVFAARMHPDSLPGFPLAVAQVATGAKAWKKSIKGHIGAFKSRWFATQPATELWPYMIVPFARGDNQFLDDVRVMGNVLHRLRVPRRVSEAANLLAAGETIEGYDQLALAARWVEEYRDRRGTMS